MFSNPDLWKFIFGRLTWQDILPETIVVYTFIVVAIGGIAIVAAITHYRKWGYLWNEWITSIDHKKIGAMYMILGLVMFVRGFSDAAMMRSQQAIAFGANQGYLPPHHYDQIFTAHGVIMIFFMAMPFVTGLMNFVVPLQIGARDVAFPFLNNFSFWMTTGGAVLTMLSLFVGEFSRATWLGFAPLSGAAYSPGVGVDYYIWGLQVAGVGTTLSGINLIATIIKMRAPGMTLMKMPVFCWTTLASNAIIVTIFPVLTATLALLSLDRYVGTHFFTNDFGGSLVDYDKSTDDSRVFNHIIVTGAALGAEPSALAGAVTGSDAVGRSSVVRARASASSQTPALRRWREPPNTGRATNFSTVSGLTVAALMMAASGRMRPGAMSRRWAMWSRVVQSSRTAASVRGLLTL